MAAGRITLDAQGKLVVPDEPTIPMAVGDGAGAEQWRVARRRVDEAVERAFGGRRRIHFVEVPAGERGIRELNDRAPTASVNAFRLYRVGVNGGQKPQASNPEVTLVRELRALLDFHLAVVPMGEGPLVVVDAGESETPTLELPAGGARAMRFLQLADTYASPLAGTLRFGTVEAVDAHHRARGELEPGVVEATVTLVPTSRQGVERLVAGAARVASIFDRQRLLLAEADGAPALASARRVTAKLAWAALPADERPKFEAARAVTIPARVAAGENGCVVAAAREGWQLVAALAPKFGGERALAKAELNVETGHALFTPLAPDLDSDEPHALVAALRSMLAYLGWSAAASQLGSGEAAPLAKGA